MPSNGASVALVIEHEAAGPVAVLYPAARRERMAVAGWRGLSSRNAW
jgi:hypothetical protein